MSFEVGNMVTPQQGLFAGRIGMVMGFSRSGQFIEVSYLPPMDPILSAMHSRKANSW